MASNTVSLPPPKRRKSCTNCHKRKTKCIPSQNPNGPCNWCFSSKEECHHPEPEIRKKRNCDNPKPSPKKKLQKPNHEPPRQLDVAPLQALQGALGQIQDSAPPFIPVNTDTVAYLGFSGDFDPHLMQYYNYDQETHVSKFINCSVRQVQNNPSFPVHFLAFADNRGLDIRNEIALQRERVKELTKGNEDRLLRLFFELVYPTYPIVDRRKFYVDYMKGSENVDICLFTGILAISIIWNKYDDVLCVKNLPNDLSDKLFNECSIAIERSLERPTLGTVQGMLLLAQKHVQSSGATLFSANIHMGKLVSVSHRLGLHLDCGDWSISQSEKRLRKRLWATVYLVEKWSSTNLGLPSILSQQNTTWDQYAEEDPSSLLFVHFGKLTVLLDGIMIDLYSVRHYASQYSDPKTTIAKVDKYFIALQKWRDELPPGLKEMSYPGTENSLKKNGILHLAELTIAVLLLRIKLHPSCTNLMDCKTLEKYRQQSNTIIQRIIKFTFEISNMHLKSFWHSIVRLNFSTLASFILFHHITSTSTEEFDSTRKDFDKWVNKVQNLKESWKGGLGVAVERINAVFMSGKHEELFGHKTPGLVKYNKDTDRIYEEEAEFENKKKKKQAEEEPEPEPLSPEISLFPVDLIQSLPQPTVIVDPIQFEDKLSFSNNSPIPLEDELSLNNDTISFSEDTSDIFSYILGSSSTSVDSLNQYPKSPSFLNTYDSDLGNEPNEKNDNQYAPAFYMQFEDELNLSNEAVSDMISNIFGSSASVDSLSQIQTSTSSLYPYDSDLQNDLNENNDEQDEHPFWENDPDEDLIFQVLGHEKHLSGSTHDLSRHS